jgi:hypothetical protein
MSNLLWKRIEKKIEKHYTRAHEGQFWLLVYSLDLPVDAHPPYARLSIERLKSSEHPFDRVWLFGPMKDETAGVLIELFPNPPKWPKEREQLDERKRETVFWKAEDLAQDVSFRRVKRGDQEEH